MIGYLDQGRNVNAHLSSLPFCYNSDYELWEKCNVTETCQGRVEKNVAVSYFYHDFLTSYYNSENLWLVSEEPVVFACPSYLLKLSKFRHEQCTMLVL